MKSGLGTLCALGTASSAGPAAATGSEASLADVSLLLRAKIAAALRSTNNDGCIEMAARLATSAGGRNLQLHLRGLGVAASDAEKIANGFRSLTHAEALLIRSFSISYNPRIGDVGAIHLAGALPLSLPELGLVGCRIGDSGGEALLTWATKATGLHMLCIERNRFSEALQSRFRVLARNRSGLSLFI